MTVRHTGSRQAMALVRNAVRFAVAQWKRLLLLFGGVLLPLYGFGELAADVWTGGGVLWDAPTLRFVHGFATPGRDAFMKTISLLGYMYGMVPLFFAVLLLLIVLRRRGDAIFFAVAVVGAMTLNQVAKRIFQRTRPDLWLSPAPETSYSFPSGHAMGSMAVMAALAVLAWPTRWRWVALIGGGVFAFTVGLSRVYLGVHFPSDVLAGWAASLAWVMGVSVVAYGRPAKPRPDATPSTHPHSAHPHAHP